MYLGEVCYRFNHRDEDLFPLLLKLPKATSRNEIDEVLVRNRYELPSSFAGRDSHRPLHRHTSPQIDIAALKAGFNLLF